MSSHFFDPSTGVLMKLLRVPCFLLFMGVLMSWLYQVSIKSVSQHVYNIAIHCAGHCLITWVNSRNSIWTSIPLISTWFNFIRYENKWFVIYYVSVHYPFVAIVIVIVFCWCSGQLKSWVAFSTPRTYLNSIQDCRFIAAVLAVTRGTMINW